MLIIEGSDCLGKTTLANSILKRVQELGEAATIRHLGRPDATFDFYTDYFSMIEPTVIQDRFHLGALAYHDNVMTADHLRIIEGWIFSGGSLVILLYCEDFLAYRKRIENDHRRNILRNDILEEANKRYTLMADGRFLPAPIIDIKFNIYPIGGDFPNYVSSEQITLIVDLWLQRRKEYYYGLEILQNSNR
jgi:thymidylate kinase